MKDFRYQENLRVIPVLAPADVTSTTTATGYVDLANCNWCTFMVTFGAITGDTTTINDTVGVTVEASTAGSSNATEEAIGFEYRLSPAVGTDTDALGTITTATSDGCSVAASDDNKILFIEINPAAVVGAKGDDFRYVRVVIDPGSAATATVVSASAILEPKYASNSMATST
jgi:hypothetical protein